MAIKSILFTILVAILLWSGGLMEGSAIAAPRAIWIWENDAFNMLNDSHAQQEVESFLVHQSISTMYLYADEFKGRNILVTEPNKYRKLIKDAHARGFKVYALLGSKYLHTENYVLTVKRSTALRMFENILDYNKHTDAASQFDGINIDIEPYLLDEWDSGRPLLGRAYLDLSATYMRLKKLSRLKLEVGPAMPFWFSGIEDVEWQGKHRKLNEDVQDIYDYVAIMDYRNVALGSDSIVSLVQDELDYGDKINKKVMIGVDTLEGLPAKTTFFGKTNQYFESQLSLVEKAMSSHSSFGGFVIHHLKTYRLLVK